MNSSTPNNRIPESGDYQETIFDDIIDLSPYEKSIKSTRNWLYIVGVIWLVWGIVNYNKIYDQNVAMMVFGGYMFVSAAFFGFAIWSRWKPAAAFLTALIFYGLLTLWFFHSSGFDIFSVAIRIFIIFSVVRGYQDARKYEELKKTQISNPED